MSWTKAACDKYRHSENGVGNFKDDVSLLARAASYLGGY